MPVNMLSLPQRWKHAHFFWKLVLSYSLIVVVVLAGHIVLLSYLHDRMAAELHRNGEQVLAHSIEMVDGEISSIRRLASQLSADRALAEFAYQTEELQSVPPISLYRLSRLFPNIAGTQQAVSSALVHFVSTDAFVTFGSGSTRSRLYYDVNLGIADMTYDQWRASIYDGRRVPGFRKEESGLLQSSNDEVIYVHFFPVEALDEPLGAILIYIDTAVILGSIDDFLVSGDAGLVIADRDGNLIASRQANAEMERLALAAAVGVDPEGSVRMGGEELTVLHATSAEHDWIYHAFVPTGVLLRQVDRMRSISVVVVVSVLALMAVIVGAMSSAFSRPIREIASMLAKPGADHPPTDEISQIRGGLASLIDRNVGLQRDLEQHTRLLRSSFLSQLLLNGFRSPAALNRYLESARLELGSGGFRVIVATVATADPDEPGPVLAAQQGARVLATRTLARSFGELAQTQTIDSDRVAMLLVRQHHRDRATLTHQLTGIARTLLTGYGIRLYFACGEVIPDLQDAAQQFRQLADHLNRAGSQRTSLVFVDEVTTPSSIYRYPIETEIQLLTLLKMGDRTGTMDVLKRVLAENRRADGADDSELFRAIIGTYLRCANELFNSSQYHGIRSQLVDARGSHDMSTFLHRSQSIVDHMCTMIMDQHESRNTQLRLRITEYLVEHSDDSMLNLYAVAKAFDLNEKYLSRFFHDQTGQTFSSFLERLRMDRAVAMLRATDATVDVVAGSVGYASTNTFHKAFRRIYSTTPGRFRRDILHSGAVEAM